MGVATAEQAHRARGNRHTPEDVADQAQALIAA
jgi:hypothetical protein